MRKPPEWAKCTSPDSGVEYTIWVKDDGGYRPGVLLCFVHGQDQFKVGYRGPSTGSDEIWQFCYRVGRASDAGERCFVWVDPRGTPWQVTASGMRNPSGKAVYLGCNYRIGELWRMPDADLVAYTDP